MKEIFPGIFRDGRELFTVNALPGVRVYGEKLLKKEKEYRNWDPTRSKLAAAILNGVKNNTIKEGSVILYIGASTGTTVSHISDIVGETGCIYGLEFAERVFRNLLDVAQKRKNLLPILADARLPEKYPWIEMADVVYVDIAQSDQTSIAIRNAKEFLKPGGLLMLVVKSQSIDVTKAPEHVYSEERKKLEQEKFDVLEVIDLEPYEDKHAMIVAKR